ncbi:MAG: tetratricopeptide repeat protein [Pseudomonadota bacterium]
MSIAGRPIGFLNNRFVSLETKSLHLESQPNHFAKNSYNLKSPSAVDVCGYVGMNMQKLLTDCAVEPRFEPAQLDLNQYTPIIFDQLSVDHSLRRFLEANDSVILMHLSNQKSDTASTDAVYFSSSKTPSLQINDEVIKELQSLAEGNDAEAQLLLGIMYCNGQGVCKDYNEGLKWLGRAAEQGNLKAQSELGVFYLCGLSEEEDLDEAVKWYSLAAEQGDADAEYNLGILCLMGYGVIRDYKEDAREWFGKAAAQGHQKAIGALFGNIPFLTKNGYEKLDFHKTRYEAVHLGQVTAQLKLGLMYFRGDNKYAKQNYEEAFKCFSLAAEQGNVAAQCNLGFMYENGHGVKQDVDEAIKCYTVAAEQGDENAKMSLESILNAQGLKQK